MLIYSKLKEIRKHLKLTQKQIQDETGLSQRDISQLENGEKKFIPTSYIQFLNNNKVPLNKLYDDNVSIKDFINFVSDTNTIEEKVNLEPKVNDQTMSIYKLKTDYYGVERQKIPLYEIEASAGLSLLFSSQNTQIPLDFITVPNAPKCDGALFVRGDSMYPLLKSGDIICYKRISNVDNIIFGEMYLLDIDNGDDQFLTVKYVQKSDKGDSFVKLVSENHYHADKDEPIHNIRALAIVKLSIRYNTIS